MSRTKLALTVAGVAVAWASGRVLERAAARAREELENGKKHVMGAV